MNLQQQALSELQQRIDSAMNVAGRTDSITTVVVTKTHGADMVQNLYDLGIRDFGENRDQEAKPKSEAFQPLEIDYRWHFIGQLQSNKVKSMLSYSSALHSLDRSSLLSELTKRVERELEVFIQLNLTDDPNRGGINPGDLVEFGENVVTNPLLKLMGVMAVAGLDQDPRSEFEKVAKLSQKLQEIAPGATFISTGMSGDFEEAIEFGATHLRIGSLITGNRNSIT